jgi:hypothetical protein
MKTMKLYLVGFLFSFSFYSQTLQVNPHRPVAGDTMKTYIMDTSGFTSGLPNNITGSNVFWDFSPIVKTSSLAASEKYLSPSSVPSASLYPSCNLVMETTPMSYNYLKSSDVPSSKLEFLGFRLGTLARATFTNSVIYSKYPFSYGQSYTDPASGTFSANTGTGTINGSVVGSISNSADGTGTLMLGQQMIPGVLRIKSVQQFTLLQGFLPLASLKIITYNYYTQTDKFPLLSCQYQSMSFALSSPTVVGSVRMNASIPLLGLEEYREAEDITLFPNPAGEYIYLAGMIDDMNAEIYSSEGRMIKHEFISKNEARLNIRDLPSGIYFLIVKNANGQFLRKARFVKASE